jgi:1,4-dihydroxy-6-naphthoate synthase
VRLTLGISPCPNDTFLFDAMLHGRVPCPFEIELVVDDVEGLNRRAGRGELDVTKISYHAAFHVLAEYLLLPSGSALGRGCGPLLVARDPGLRLGDLPGCRIATPGAWTTAQLLLRLMQPGGTRTLPMVFDQVLPALAEGRAEAGLLIHELRFTYQALGFHLLADLGSWWEGETGCAIPLGGILARRSLGPRVHAELARLIRLSTEASFRDPEPALPFMQAHAATMDPEVMRRHVGLYVNEFTLDLGEEGRRAVTELHRRAVAAGVLAGGGPEPLG